jgi:hypothetical protein
VRRLAVGNTSASYECAVAPSAEPTTISDRVLLTITFDDYPVHGANLFFSWGGAAFQLFRPVEDDV